MKGFSFRKSKALVHLVWAIAVAGAAAWIFFSGPWLLPSARQTDSKVAVSLLKSELMSFLVTRRTTTQVVVEHQESDWAGEWRGVLWVKASWRWGMDLGKLRPQDISQCGDAWVVRLPEPEMLDFAIVPSSTGWMTKATAVPKALDFLRGGSHRQVLEAQVSQQAMWMAAEAGMLPTRSEMIAQLNEASGLILQGTGTKVVFE